MAEDRVHVLPVFIVGYPRSGTTLVHHAIMTSGEFPSLGVETHYFSHYFRRYGNLKEQKNAARLRDALAESIWWPKLNLPDDMLQECIVNAEGDYGRVFDAIMSAFASSHGVSAWIEKTPWHMLYIPEIRSVFPNAKFIVMVRDPRDVALSVIAYGWSRSLTKCLVAWRWHMRQLQSDLRRCNLSALFIRYEDFVNEPGREFRRCEKFLGMKLTDSYTSDQSFGVMRSGNSSYEDKMAGISKSGVGRWLKKMSSKEAAIADRIVREELSEFGYPESGQEGATFVDNAVQFGISTAYHQMKRLRRALYPILLR